MTKIFDETEPALMRSQIYSALRVDELYPICGQRSSVVGAARNSETKAR